MFKLSCIFLCILKFSYITYSQADSTYTKSDTTSPENTFKQQDIKDWIAKRKSKEVKPPKDNFLFIIPYISANPTAGFMIGAGLTYTYKLRKTDQYLSVISSAVSYSTNKFINANIKSNMFVFKERLFLNGDWRFLVNGETTYGLGTSSTSPNETDIDDVPISKDSLGQKLKYNQIRIHETGSYKLFKNFFAGIGIQFDHFYNISDDVLNKGDTALSHHYQYSIHKGFDPKKYTTFGVSLNFLFDSRDNQVNAYRGYYANLNYRVNLMGLGSSQNSTVLLTEFRSYYPLDGIKQRHILGFWLYGNFVTSGYSPYLALPALGYDQRQRTGRGYKFGQFRGENMMYGEMEYRFPISMHSGILGGVLFINSTSTSDKKNNVQLFDFLKQGYGGGLRIMLDKTSRSRLEIDAGLSKNTFGFYLGVQETF
jgi:outer membrane protein assembly factor BamA